MYLRSSPFSRLCVAKVCLKVCIVTCFLISVLATPAKHAKSDNVAFYELAYKIDLPVPETPQDCPEGYFISRSNSTIVFEPEQRGKKVHGIARWVNKNSKVGSWSGLITAIVP